LLDASSQVAVDADELVGYRFPAGLVSLLGLPDASLDHDD